MLTLLTSGWQDLGDFFFFYLSIDLNNLYYLFKKKNNIITVLYKGM